MVVVRRATVLAALSTLVCLVPAHVMAQSPAAGPGADLRPGRAVRIGDVSVVVPPPGHGVWAAALDARAGWRTIGVQTSADGRISILQAGSAPAARSEGKEDPCTDGAYALLPTTWAIRYKWYFNVSTTPKGVTQDNATSAVRAAATNITQANNDCGLSDNVSATETYQGTTTKSPNIGTNGSCLGSDGTNVLAFGDLPQADLALACWWSVGNQTVEGDVKLNKVEYSWVVNIGPNCLTKFSVEAVSTHEFGHVFGLDDLSEALHPALTMSQVIMACQASETTLGLGDVLGLEAQY